MFPPLIPPALSAAGGSAYGGKFPSLDLIHVFTIIAHPVKINTLQGYPNVRWYDAGWAERAAHSELLIMNGTQDLKKRK